MNALSAFQLQRKPNTRSRRANSTSSSSSSKKPSRFSRSQSLRKQPLHIIHELSDEDEAPRFSIASEEQALRAPSPAFTMMMTPPRGSEGGSDEAVRAKIGRRQASVMPVFRSTTAESSLLEVPARSSTEGSSPDSFSITFSDKPFGFPRPPLPTPTSAKYSSGSFPSSPCSSEHSSSESEADDMDLLMSSTSGSDSRTHVEPLRIVKRRRSFSRAVSSASSSQPTQAILVVHGSDSEEELYEESNDDIDFYAAQFNKILTLNSPLPASFPAVEVQRKARPETLYVPAPASRLHKPVPSPQLDPSFSSPSSSPSPSPTGKTIKRSSLAPVVPSRPPPPPPKTRPSSRNIRPPPRISVPADFDGFDVELCGDRDTDLSDMEIVDIFDLYPSTPLTTISPRTASSFFPSPTVSQCSESVYSSQEDSSVPQDIELEDDDFFFTREETPVTQRIVFNLDLPVTPTMDLEAEVVNGLEALRRGAVAEPLVEVAAVQEAEPEAQSVPELQLPEEHASEELVEEEEEPSHEDILDAYQYESEAEPDRLLRSRWSSSTLSSTYSAHRPSHSTIIPAKLRTYFSSPKSPKGHKSRASGSLLLGFARQQEKELPPVTPYSSRFPTTPTSPWSFPASPSPTSSPRFHTPQTPSPMRRPSRRPSTRGSDNGSSSGRSSCDSCSVISDDASVLSGGSSGSDGLRRKPIPVEMFLRA